jgi:pumilio homology domain family member 6
MSSKPTGSGSATSASKRPNSKKRGSKEGGSSHKTIKKPRITTASAATYSNKSNKSSNSDKKRDIVIKQDRQRRHADVVVEAKLIWNKLRLKTNTGKERRALMDELMPLIRGKANEITLQHDASRVVQAAIQFGTEKERRDILNELVAGAQHSSASTGNNNNLVELCKSQYAHFTVLKVIKYCHNDPLCVAVLVKALKGSMSKLAVHAVASRVIESLFKTLKPRQKAVLKQEFYGPHFSLFAADTLQQQDAVVPTLQSNIASAPDKKDQTLLFVKNLVDKGLDKSLYGYTYFQEILAEYIALAKSNEIRAMASSGADHVIHLLSTRAGTRAAAAFIAYGTAKDRKRILKSTSS